MVKKMNISVVFLFALFVTVKASDKADNEKKPVGIDFFLNVKNISNIQVENGNIFFVLIGSSIGSDIGASGRAKVTFDKDGVRFVTTAVDYVPLIHIAFKDGKITFLTPTDINILEYIPYEEGFLR